MRRHDDSDEARWQEPRRQEPRRQEQGRQKPPRQKPPRETGRRAAGARRRSPALLASGILASAVALALVGGSLFAYVKYREVWDSIKRVDVSGDLRQIKQPPADPNAINILLIGSDSRAGENGAIGGRVGIAGQRSDTVMVAHIAPGAHSAVVLSFPRDSVVPVLSCTAEAGASGQTAQPGQMEQINSTFANGGPGCLQATIEETTHIHVNDFVELTFTGFEKVINDLGGVNVCLPKAVDDPKSGLNLPAGRHHIYGSQALAFWRTREDLGEGSDLQRIQRDQFLMASLLQGIEKSGLLTSTSKMTSVIGDAARSMTTDSALDQSGMLRIGEGMHGLTSKSVQFIEVPTMTYAGNGNWVQWTPQATQLFSAVANDTKLPKTTKTKTKTKTKTPTAAATKKAASATLATVSPAKVNVEVLNGSGFNKVAAEGSADLTARGFNVVGSTNASNFNYTRSVIEYASAADLAAAKTVEQQFTDPEILENPALAPGTIDAILGSTFTSLKPVTTTSPTSDLTHTFGGITGSTSICGDGSAFAGPDGGLSPVG
jgi:LCP family protein required for cell wall assembly